MRSLSLQAERRGGMTPTPTLVEIDKLDLRFA